MSIPVESTDLDEPNLLIDETIELKVVSGFILFSTLFPTFRI